MKFCAPGNENSRWIVGYFRALVPLPGVCSSNTLGLLPHEKDSPNHLRSQLAELVPSVALGQQHGEDVGDVALLDGGAEVSYDDAQRGRQLPEDGAGQQPDPGRPLFWL